MDKEQAVLNSDLKMWSSTVLKHLSNYTVTMSNNSDYSRIS